MKINIYLNPDSGKIWLTVGEFSPADTIEVDCFSPWRLMGSYKIEDKISLLIDGVFGRPHIEIYQLQEGEEK